MLDKNCIIADSFIRNRGSHVTSTTCGKCQQEVGLILFICFLAHDLRLSVVLRGWDKNKTAHLEADDVMQALVQSSQILGSESSVTLLLILSRCSSTARTKISLILLDLCFSIVSAQLPSAEARHMWL